MRVIKAFYQSTDWFKARAQAMSRDGYLCRTCGMAVRGKGEAHVDHKVSRKLRPDLELDLDNLVTLCVSCHSSKTRAHDDARGSGRTKVRVQVDINGFPESWR